MREEYVLNLQNSSYFLIILKAGINGYRVLKTVMVKQNNIYTGGRGTTYTIEYLKKYRNKQVTLIQCM